MQVTQWSKGLHLFLILIIFIGSTGCDVGANVTVEAGPETRQVLEDAIDELGNLPGQWETTLNSVVDELGVVGSALAEDIRREVQTLIGASTQIVQEAAFCQIDFIGIRAKQHLQAILHKYFPDSDPAVFTPVICTANPTVVQSGSTSQVEYSGFDFSYFRDHGTFNADLVYGDTGELIRADFGTVNVVSNYHIVVDIQGFDYAAIISSRHPSLVVRWNSDTIGGQSEVPVNIILTPTTAPPTVYIYELDYSTSYPVFVGGPDRGTGPVEISCPTGSVATGLHGYEGDYVTGLGLRCSPLNSDGTTGLASKTDAFGNNGGTSWENLVCPVNTALTTIDGVAWNYVDWVKGGCTDMDGLETFETGPSGEGGTVLIDAECPAGYFVTGISVRWGDYIDGLTMICTEVTKK